MIRDLIFLILGLALLWTPRGWLRLGRAEGASRRTTGKPSGGPNRDRAPGDNSVWLGEEFARRRNWIDLLRGLAGGYAVMVTVPTLLHALLFDVPGLNLVQLQLATQGGILLAAVMIQMVRIEERLTLFPPLFFLLGLAFPIVGVKAALIGFFAIWSINVVLPNPAMFLTAYAGGIAILSVFIGHGAMRGVLMAGLAAFPPLVAVLFRRRLAQFRKRTKIVIR